MTLQEWEEKAKKCDTFRSKLSLVTAIETDAGVPPHIAKVAKDARLALHSFIKGGESDRTDLHTANHRFKSFMLELANLTHR